MPIRYIIPTMNLLLTQIPNDLYKGIFPDFGILSQLDLQTDYEISNAHAAWDGLIIILIPAMIYLSWRGFKKWVIFRKQLKVNSLMKEFAGKDSFWNKELMKTMAENLFHEVQSAWLHSNFKPLAPLLTDKLKMEWQDTWQQMKLCDYVFIVGKIDVRSVTIISVEDHFDDNRDRFKVEVSGYIKRYVKNKPDGSMLVRTSHDFDEFMDIYSFVRYNDQWLLDEIDHSTTIREVILAKNKNHHLLN